MDAQQERLAVLANNLANATAAGYKADQPEFFQLLTSPRAAGSVSPTGSAAPLPELPGVVHTRVDFSSGPLRETGNPLDFALEGKGFFVVRAQNGNRLTRAGTFTRLSDGNLGTQDGMPVLGADGRPLTLPDGARLSVDERGNVSVDGSEVGTLMIVAPDDPSRLTKEAGTRFAAPADMALPAATDVTVRQGAIEQSNVNPILTLVEMIDALRVYEAAQKAAHGVDETVQRAVNEVGRPAGA